MVRKPKSTSLSKLLFAEIQWTMYTANGYTVNILYIKTEVTTLIHLEISITPTHLRAEKSSASIIHKTNISAPKYVDTTLRRENATPPFGSVETKTVEERKLGDYSVLRTNDLYSGFYYDYYYYYYYSCVLFLIISLEAPLSFSINTQVYGFALLKFRVRMNSDPHGTLSNWNVSGSDLCSWSRVTCVEGEASASTFIRVLLSVSVLKGKIHKPREKHSILIKVKLDFA
ncbi:hypothetical protein YC2023_086984 [Brassica napus]